MKSKSLGMVERDFARDLKYMAERIDQWHTIKETYYDFLDKLDEIIPAAKDGEDSPITVYGGYSLTVYARGDGKLLIQIVRALRTTGWKTDADPPAKNANGWHVSFYKEKEGVVTRNRVELNFTSSVCKQVQVGTKMVEQPVYETQCGDLTIEEDERPNQGMDQPHHSHDERDDLGVAPSSVVLDDQGSFP